MVSSIGWKRVWGWDYKIIRLVESTVAGTAALLSLAVSTGNFVPPGLVGQVVGGMKNNA